MAALHREVTAPSWSRSAFHLLDQSSNEGGQYMPTTGIHRTERESIGGAFLPAAPSVLGPLNSR